MLIYCQEICQLSIIISCEMDSAQIISHSRNVVKKNLTPFLSLLCITLIYYGFLDSAVIDTFSLGNKSSIHLEIAVLSSFRAFLSTILKIFVVLVSAHIIRRSTMIVDDPLSFTESLKMLYHFVTSHFTKVIQIFGVKFTVLFLFQITVYPYVEEMITQLTNFHLSFEQKLIALSNDNLDDNFQSIQQLFAEDLKLMKHYFWKLTDIILLQVLHFIVNSFLSMFDWISVDRTDIDFFAAIKISVQSLLNFNSATTYLGIYFRLFWIWMFIFPLQFFTYVCLTYFYFQYCLPLVEQNRNQGKQTEIKNIKVEQDGQNQQNRRQYNLDQVEQDAEPDADQPLIIDDEDPKASQILSQYSNKFQKIQKIQKQAQNSENQQRFLASLSKQNQFRHEKKTQERVNNIFGKKKKYQRYRIKYFQGSIFQIEAK